MLLVRKMSILSLFVSVKKRLVIILLNDFVEKKETFLSIKKQNFSSPKTCIFSKKKAEFSKVQFLLYLDLVKIRLEIILNYLEERKETYLTLKERIFQSPNNRILFFKAVKYFWPKNAKFLFFIHVVKIRLEIMLSDFAERNEICFNYKNRSS